MKNLLPRLTFVMILAVGVLFRTVRLDDRVAHHDEANQIVKTGILLDTGAYHYDPDEHHGPTLYYFAVSLLKISGAQSFVETELWTYRLLPALFGMGLILLLLVLRSGLGWGAMLIAALLTAISTAMTYYSRFYIQEVVLVFFTFSAIASGWRYMRSRSMGWAIAAGLSLGLMHATKETCVIAYGCMLAAVLVAIFWSAGGKFDPSVLKLRRRHTLAAVASGLVISMVLFSSFFTHPPGILDSMRTYAGYLGRGAGVGMDHAHPFFYYLGMLFYYKEGGLAWSEGLIMILGLAGVVMVLLRAKALEKMDQGLVRFLVIYTVLMTLAYSAIPYKTPWCMLSFLHGWILLAGVGAAGLFVILRRRSMQVGAGLVLVTACSVLAVQTSRAVFRYGADERNPYAYAHTVQPFMNLVHRVHDIAGIHPDGTGMPIALVTTPEDAWPLPWYLRAYPNVGYWNTTDAIPEGFDPAIIISSVEKEDDVSSFVGEDYLLEYWGLRVEVPLGIHVRRDLWNQFMEHRVRVGMQKGAQ